MTVSSIFYIAYLKFLPNWSRMINDPKRVWGLCNGLSNFRWLLRSWWIWNWFYSALFFPCYFLLKEHSLIKNNLKLNSVQLTWVDAQTFWIRASFLLMWVSIVNSNIVTDDLFNSSRFFSSKHPDVEGKNSESCIYHLLVLPASSPLFPEIMWQFSQPWIYVSNEFQTRHPCMTSVQYFQMFKLLFSSKLGTRLII